MDSSKITINNQDFLSAMFVGPLVEITNSLKYFALLYIFNKSFKQN